MKLILTILTFFLWSHLAVASDSTIVFHQINYSDLFEIARKENKGVMIYFHYDGCGACTKMEKTAFKDKRVIDFFNTNFINFEINTLKGEGKEINKTYNIRLHPTFIIFDSDGKELHRLVGVFSPEDFYEQANNALLSNINLTSYKKKYKAGNREPDFLLDYAYMLRDASELDSSVVNEYLDAIDKKDYVLEKNIKFIYEFCIHDFKTFIPFNNPRFTFLLKNKNLFYEHFDRNQVIARIVWILNSTIYKAIEEKDDSTFYLAIDLLEEYDNGDKYVFKEMDGRITGMINSKNIVLSSMLSYYESKDDHLNYMKTLDKYILKIWNDADELNNLAWNIYENANAAELEKLEAAIKCSVRSIELNDNYANNDTYAWLLYKIGEVKKSLKQAEKTIEIAKENNLNYSETQKLVDKIEY